MEEKNFWRYANRLGLFFIILYLICFVWHFFFPVDLELRIKLFQMGIIGFSGFNLFSLISGAVQVYFWAYIGLGLWRLVGPKNPF